MTDFNFGFDGNDSRSLGQCPNCPKDWHEHDKERVSPDDGTGTWYYEYIC